MFQSPSGEASRYREDLLSAFAPRIPEEGVPESRGMPNESPPSHAPTDNGARPEIRLGQTLNSVLMIGTGARQGFELGFDPSNPRRGRVIKRTVFSLP